MCVCVSHLSAGEIHKHTHLRTNNEQFNLKLKINLLTYQNQTITNN